MTTRDDRGRSRVRELGFTLIEMMVTIGIILIALGFMVPSLSEAFRNRKLSNAGDIIVSKMNEARNNAVSRKQVFTVVFLQKGVRLFREPRGGDPGGFEGSTELMEPDGQGLVTYALQFARQEGLSYEDIPGAAEDVDPGDSLTDTTNVYLRFLPDGTIDFNRNRDISSLQYKDNRNADIVISQQSLPGVQGLIDVRPTGRVSFKVEEVQDDWD